MLKTRIKALILDYGGVISKPQDFEHVENMLCILEQEYKDFEIIYRGSRAEYDSGHKTGTEYWMDILNHFDIEFKSADIATLIQEDVKSWTRINDSMIRFVNEIRSEIYKLSIISNMTEDTLAHIRTGFKWLDLFDELIFSCEFGTNKPDKKIYEVCLDKLKLSPKECLFVDDSAENIEGASAIGMNTIHFKSFDEFFSEFNKKFISVQGFIVSVFNVPS